MKAIFNVPHPDGGYSELRDIPLPSPGPGEVLVKVHASAINRGELTGIRKARKGEASVGGLEFAGEVIESGEGATAYVKGDAVMGQFRACHAEYLAIDQRLLLPVPKGLAWEEAAAFPNCYVTAHDALITNAGLQAGETVMITAASSGIGVASLQIAAAFGASVIIGTSRQQAKLDRLSPYGMTLGIDSSDSGLSKTVLQATDGRGVDIVIDCVGGQMLEENMNSLALLGRFVSVGRLGAKSAPIDLDLLALKRLKLIGVTFRTRTLQDRIECTQRCGQDLLPLLAAGKIKPVVAEVFPVEKIADAQRLMESDAHIGKIVLRF